MERVDFLRTKYYKRHVEKDLRDRDERDSKRKHSPLIVSPDAVLIDTTNLDADEVFLLAKNNVEEYLRY